MCETAVPNGVHLGDEARRQSACLPISPLDVLARSFALLRAGVAGQAAKQS
jgi:hypothetical protein